MFFWFLLRPSLCGVILSGRHTLAVSASNTDTSVIVHAAVNDCILSVFWYDFKHSRLSIYAKIDTELHISYCSGQKLEPPAVMKLGISHFHPFFSPYNSGETCCCLVVICAIQAVHGFDSQWRQNIFNSVLFKKAGERERIHLRKLSFGPVLHVMGHPTLSTPAQRNTY